MPEEKGSSQVESLIQNFKRRRNGIWIPDVPWYRIQLTLSEYQELERRLAQDEELWGYVDDKVRYDYIPRTGRFTLRISRHEPFISGVAEHIIAQLRGISSSSADSAAAIFARKVHDMRHSRIILLHEDHELPVSRHEPDCSFQHAGARFPGVVIEVSYPQKRRDMARLADSYILDSNTNIRVVVGLGVEYEGSRRATVSVWKPEIVMEGEEKVLMAKQTVVDEAFRDDHGNPTSSPGLQLQLSDFAHSGMTAGLPSDVSVTISATQLCDALSISERFINMQNRLNRSRTARKRVLGPQVRKRRREATPPGKSSDEREARFKGLEEQADKRQELEEGRLKH